MWEAFSRTFSLIVTNLIKLGGLFAGLHELIVHGKGPNAIVLAFSAFAMAGAQFSETAILSFIERFFGIEHKQKDEHR